MPCWQPMAPLGPGGRPGFHVSALLENVRHCSHLLYCRGPFIWSCYVSGGVSYMSLDVGFLRGVAKLDKSLPDILPPRRNK